LWALGGESSGTPLNQVQSILPGVEAGWTGHTPMPTTAYGIAAVAAGDKIYVFGGKTHGNVVLSNLAVYSPATDSWSNAVAQMPRPRYGHSAVLAPDGRIVVLAGESSSGAHVAEVDVYNPATDLWSSAAALPTPRSFLTATLQQNSGSVTGGSVGVVTAGGLQQGVASTAVEELLLGDDVWRTRRPLVEARFGAACASLVASAAVDGHETQGWVLGGQLGTGPTPTALVYTQAQDYLRRLTPLPEARFMHAAATAREKVYVFAGRSAVPVTTAWAFDPEAGTSTPVADLPSVQEGLVAVTANDLVYAFGGADSAGVAVAHVRSYDPATSRWTERQPMPTGRRDAAAAVVGGLVYVIGGDNGAALQTVEIYDPVQDDWTSGPLLPETRTGAVAASWNGELYVLGGSDGGSVLRASVLKLDLGSWSVVPGVTLSVANARALQIGSVAVVAQGRSLAGVSATLWSVDLADLSPAAPLVRLNPLTVPAQFAAAAVVNGNMYLLGGNGSPTLAPPGLGLVQKLKGQCFDRAQNGRETAQDSGGGCGAPDGTYCSGHLGPEWADGDIRLVGCGDSGLLEVYHAGSWRAVCDDHWDQRNAWVACRQMFGSAASGTYGAARMGPHGAFWMDEVVCTGDEPRLSACPFAGWGNHDCANGEWVLLSCMY
ncbi:MAG: hypothetical protein HY901_24200, partial [Deltaproteobacteria bacterium]|nr:hypothetical protein [Deltaproteobacteria bacterium]